MIPQERQQVPTIEAADLPEGTHILDVREVSEWEAGHAPHARHIPLGELVQRLDELPADGTVHVMCRSGGRSSRVTAYLNTNGYEAVNIGGGMAGWAQAGRPMISDSGTPKVI